ncbi:TIGR04255 family protein [Methyloprofundus sp.]|uniref:TIGR04255 family protein n=1 Tax=Methyloprofundus sp. TaxID=2020875 RepID=UPI003D110888
MNAKKLPHRLNKEPLLEALFEIRFTCNVPASTVLPGLLFSKLEGEKKIENLPTEKIPSEIRNTDPNLRFAPVSRLTWNQLHINIGDRNLSISCSSNYPGWKIFKGSILKIIKILQEIDIIQSIERHSIKYINLIPFDGSVPSTSLLNLDIEIAKHKILNEFFQFRVEINHDNFVNVVNIISSATVPSENTPSKKGIIVDIDTIATSKNSLNNLLDDLERIRQANKDMFFSCLTQATVDYLEPEYE